MTNEKEAMNQKLTDIVSQIYPSLIREENIFLVDILGLLGYVTTFGLDKWKEFQTPEFFQDLTGAFDETMTVSKDPEEKIAYFKAKRICSIQSLYETWVQYLQDLNGISGIGMELAHNKEGKK